MEPRNRCQGINSASLCSLAGRYDNPIPSRCLAFIDFLKIPALLFDQNSVFDLFSGHLVPTVSNKYRYHYFVCTVFSAKAKHIGLLLCSYRK